MSLTRLPARRDRVLHVCYIYYGKSDSMILLGIRRGGDGGGGSTYIYRSLSVSHSISLTPPPLHLAAN